MVLYLFELGYDLMISPEDNVSNSPGFEVRLAIYGSVRQQMNSLIKIEYIIN